MVHDNKTCIGCKQSKPNNYNVHETLLGRNLSSVILRLCDAKVKNDIKITDAVCESCALELIYADKLLTKVHTNFGQNLQSTKTESHSENGINSLVANATTTEAFVFHCQTCKFETDKIKTYKSHMSTKHGETAPKPYTCNQCGQTFTRHDHFQTHLTKIHCLPDEKSAAKTREKTPIARKKVSNLDAFENNADAEDDEFNDEIFKCPECKYASDKPKIYRRHMLKMHNYEENAIFRCPKCSKGYARHFGYRQHIEKVHFQNQEPTFACNQCEQKFHTNFSLERHIKAAHQNNTLVVNSTIKAVATSTPLYKNSNENSMTNAKMSKTLKKKQHLLEEIADTPAKKKKKNQILVKEEEKTVVKDPSVEMEETYQCTHCSKSLSSVKKFKKHIAKKHNIIDN